MVSIIIPVYNCDSSLTVTLESVRLQSYSDLEVILVDDGSEDSSGHICDDFCSIDSRFKVIHQANKGVGEARNVGLRAAKGEYISFIDGGDYVHFRTIEHLLYALESSNLDLSMIGVTITNVFSEDIFAPTASAPNEVVLQDALIHNMISSNGPSLLQWAVVWNKLYRKSLLEGLWFKNYICNEDQDLNIRVYLRIDSAIFVHEPLYYYVRVPDSTIHNPKTLPQRLLVHTLSRYEMYSYLSDSNRTDYIGWLLDSLYRDLLTRRSLLRGKNTEKDFTIIANKILKNTLGRYLFNRYIPFKRKIKFMVYYFFPKSKKMN